MKTFRNSAEAEAAGYLNFGRAPDQRPLFMHGTTAERATVLTPLEAQLLEALEAVEWDHEGMCPWCHGSHRAWRHADDCKLFLAIKSASGETGAAS
jgi:hypothetical protein